MGVRFGPGVGARAASVPRCRRVAWQLGWAAVWAVAMAGERAHGAGPATAEEPTSAPIRGAVWVDPFAHPYREPVKLDQLVSELRTLPFDDVILPVYLDGRAFFRTTAAPPALGIPEGFDPLARLVEVLHAEPRPRRLIAWVVPYRIEGPTDVGGTLDPAALGIPDEWLSLDADGRARDAEGRGWLEPTLPAVQQRLESLIADLASRYAIDELYLDPMTDGAGDGRWGYHPAALAQWTSLKGAAAARPQPDDPEWIAWRAAALERALVGLADAARRARPGLTVAVGAETLGPPPDALADFEQSVVYRLQHQHWARWLSERRVDKLYLKNFRPESSHGPEFDRWTQLALEAGRAAGVTVAIGVSGPMNVSIDALAQLRRAADRGAGVVALADLGRPVRDMGARTLFFNALASSVLAPDYRARTRPTAAAVPTSPTMVARPADRPTTTVVEAVPFEPERAPTPVVGGTSPATPTLTRGGGIDDATRAALEVLRGGRPSPTPTPPIIVRTRRDLLRELLEDPIFAQSRGGSLLRPSEDAREYLRQAFPNIF